MKLVVGLGNPGAEYHATRHNIGFRIVAAEASELRTRKRLHAAVEKRGDVVLCQPITFMNESGRAVAAIMEYFHIASHDVLVIFDDIDLPFGVLRVRSQGSAGTHRGMQSVIAYLDTTAIPRIRVGIRDATRSMPEDLATFVVARFSKKEERQLPHIVSQARRLMHQFINEGTLPHHDIHVLDSALR